MSLYTLIIVTFVIFMAINVIIGLRGRKHASTTKDFLTASGQSGIWFIIASAVGASIGSGVVIGTTQYAVKLGVAGAWYAIACGLACVVHAFVMTRFIYRNKLVSFSDYFKRRYDSNFIILLYSGIGPFACAASMGGQLVAAKAIFQAFGIDPTIGLVITAAVMLVYTMFAGLWGSYATAVFQVGVIIVGVLVVGISMFTQGGVAEMQHLVCLTINLVEMMCQLTGGFQIDIGHSTVLFQILELHTTKASVGCRLFLRYH